jgi:type VI protein secretion system component Hcp
MPVYMNWGASVPPIIRGDVTTTGHVGWIALTSVQIGPHRPPAAPKGGRSESRLTPDEVLITKGFDSSTPGLYAEAARGGSGTPVLIDFVRIEKGKLSVENALKLKGVIISGASASAGQEAFRLNYTEIEWGKAQGVTPHPTAPPQR